MIKRTLVIGAAGLAAVAGVWWFTDPPPDIVEVTRRHEIVLPPTARGKDSQSLSKKPEPDETTVPSEEFASENEATTTVPTQAMAAAPRGMAESMSVATPIASVASEQEIADSTEQAAIPESTKTTPEPIKTPSHLMAGTNNHAAKFRVSDLQDLSEPTTVPTSTPQSLPLLGGQARGFTMMYLMHPKARQTVDNQVQTLLKANIRDLYLSILIDGTFGLDFNYASSVMRQLSQSGHNLTLVLYLTNGSSMRRFDQGVVTAGFNLLSPTDFRTFIVSDASIRTEFLTMVRQARTLFTLNEQLGADNTNIAIVMLEDNLDVTSYAEMRRLAKRLLPASVEYVRNPCPGCWPGNDTDPVGDGLEVHSPDLLKSLSPRDGFNLDGFGYTFPWETNSKQLSLGQVKDLINIAAQRQIRYFGLWRAQRQGIGVQGLIDPDQREYEVPTQEMEQVEIDLLREGLTPVE